MLLKNNPIYILLLVPIILSSRSLVDFHGIESADKDTSYYLFEFTLSNKESRMVFDFSGTFESGEINVRLTGGGYEVIGNYTEQDTFSHNNIIFGPLNNSEPIRVQVQTTKAIGEWTIKLTESSSSGVTLSFLASGILIIITCILLLIKWKVRSGESFIYPLLGAAAWFISIIAKFLFAYWLNTPILEFIKSALGQTGYLTIGSLYIGSLTGIFEIGIALVFVLSIRKLYENAERGIGYGLGAGTIEALLIGFSQVGAFIMLITGSPGSDNMITEYSSLASNTPVLFLVAPVERIIAILCHTSSRALIVLAAAKRKQIYLWLGFLIMTGIDAVAGYAHLAGYVTTVSTWWIELALVPFAILSIIIIIWYYNNWSRKHAVIGSGRTTATDSL